MLDDPDTNELIARARDGGDSAVNGLLARRRAWLSAFVRGRMDRRLGQRFDQSDVVQDVLLEASQRLREYLADPKLPFPIWLKQLAEDRMIDLHRRHRVATKRSIDREQVRPAGDSSASLFSGIYDQAATPAASLLKQEFERRFLDALALLDDADREVVCLRHLDQLSNGDVAAALGLTSAAAGMRYLRALRRLREILGQCDF